MHNPVTLIRHIYPQTIPSPIPIHTSPGQSILALFFKVAFRDFILALKQEIAAEPRPMKNDVVRLHIIRSRPQRRGSRRVL